MKSGYCFIKPPQICAQLTSEHLLKIYAHITLTAALWSGASALTWKHQHNMF